MSHVFLAELLSPDRIRIPIEARDKRGVIEEMCAFLADVEGVSEEEAAQIRDAVLEREEVLTTGIGGGVAIPHGKSEALKGLVLVAGKTDLPLDFGALDERPVQVIMLLVGPERASGEHVRTLSRISRLLRSSTTRRRLFAASTPEEFHAAIAKAEGVESRA